MSPPHTDSFPAAFVEVSSISLKVQPLLCLPDNGVGVLGQGKVVRDVYAKEFEAVDSFRSLSFDVYRTRVCSLAPSTTISLV